MFKRFVQVKECNASSIATQKKAYDQIMCLDISNAIQVACDSHDLRPLFNHVQYILINVLSKEERDKWCRECTLHALVHSLLLPWIGHSSLQSIQSEYWCHKNAYSYGRADLVLQFDNQSTCKQQYMIIELKYVSNEHLENTSNSNMWYWTIKKKHQVRLQGTTILQVYQSAINQVLQYDTKEWNDSNCTRHVYMMVGDTIIGNTIDNDDDDPCF